MINYHIHENGWTVILDDVDFNTLTQEDVNHIARLVATNTCVIAKKQNLTLENELRILKMFKNPKPLFQPTDLKFKHCSVDPEGIICRVTAERNEHGHTGIGANPGDFDWHNNLPWDPNRSPIIWLYGVRGTVDSRTSWNNNILAYNDLDNDTKEQLKKLKLIVLSPEMSDGHQPASWVNDKHEFDFVYTNNAGQTGLYFPVYDIDHFVGMSREESLKLIQPLIDHVLQEKYLYHHDWDDGDISISDQWLGVHKRWKFVSLETRVLHRAAVDYPDQNYQGIE